MALTLRKKQKVPRKNNTDADYADEALQANTPNQAETLLKSGTSCSFGYMSMQTKPNIQPNRQHATLDGASLSRTLGISSTEKDIDTRTMDSYR